MLEYNWTRLLSKCVHAVTSYFLPFRYLKNYTFKKKDENDFLVRPSIIYLQKISIRRCLQMVPTWAEAGQKFDFFAQKSSSFCNSKHFRQKIMTLYYLCYFRISSIFSFFQIIMVSLFLSLSPWSAFHV